MIAIAQHPLPNRQTVEDSLAIKQGARFQVPAIHVDKVESVEIKLVIMSGFQCGLQTWKAGDAVFHATIRVRRPSGGIGPEGWQWPR